jgi:hypothetical protein
MSPKITNAKKINYNLTSWRSLYLSSLTLCLHQFALKFLDENLGNLVTFLLGKAFEECVIQGRKIMEFYN